MAAQSAPPNAPRDVRDELAALNQKLDRLTDQVGHLYERTRAVEELKEEVMPLAKDGLAALQEELQDLDVDGDQVVYLLRRLAQSTPRIIRVLDWLEAVDTLADELEPLSKEVMAGAVARLQEMEEHGHLRLLRGGYDLLDRVATHYDQEDVDKLSHNIVHILDTIKGATQPEVLQVANNALSVIHEVEGGTPPKVGLWGLVRAMREPEVQEGLGVLLQLLRQVSRGHHAAAKANESAAPQQGETHV